MPVAELSRVDAVRHELAHLVGSCLIDDSDDLELSILDDGTEWVATCSAKVSIPPEMLALRLCGVLMDHLMLTPKGSNLTRESAATSLLARFWVLGIDGFLKLASSKSDKDECSRLINEYEIPDFDIEQIFTVCSPHLFDLLNAPDSAMESLADMLDADGKVELSRFDLQYIVDERYRPKPN